MIVNNGWQIVEGAVRRGHGVASGVGRDERYPEGTIRMQAPLFAQRGLDLSGYFLGTINVGIAPRRFRIVAPRLTFRDVAWSPFIPPEHFSFCDCRIEIGGVTTDALIYWPHPETKPVEHRQADDVLEVLAPRLPGIRYDMPLRLWLPQSQIEIRP